MKLVAMFSGAVTLFLLLSAMACGLWLKTGGAGSIGFHIACGILSIISCLMTLVLMGIHWHVKEGGKVKR